MVERRRCWSEAGKRALRFIEAQPDVFLRNAVTFATDKLNEIGRPDPFFNDPDYSPAYQDEYQRLWHEARAKIERLREALNQHRPPSCPCRACEAVKLAAAQEPPASTSTDVKDGRCQKCGGFPLLDECGCLSGPWQEPPAEGGDCG